MLPTILFVLYFGIGLGIAIYSIFHAYRMGDIQAEYESTTEAAKRTKVGLLFSYLAIFLVVILIWPAPLIFSLVDFFHER